VGPKSVSYHKITAEALAGMIRQAVDDTEMRDRATALGRRIESEHGVEKAVEYIAGFLEGKK
jgi:sterol 3beta-glucosyltransferase